MNSLYMKFGSFPYEKTHLIQPNFLGSKTGVVTWWFAPKPISNVQKSPGFSEEFSIRLCGLIVHQAGVFTWNCQQAHACLRALALVTRVLRCRAALCRATITPFCREPRPAEPHKWTCWHNALAFGHNSFRARTWLVVVFGWQITLAVGWGQDMGESRKQAARNMNAIIVWTGSCAHVLWSSGFCASAAGLHPPLCAILSLAQGMLAYKHCSMSC